MYTLLLAPLYLTLVSSVLIRPKGGAAAFTKFSSRQVYDTLSALELLLKYFDTNRGSMIVDSMWGIRMIEGGLKDGRLHQSPGISPDIIERMIALEKYAGDIATRGTPYAHRNAKVQYKKFSALLAEPFVYETLIEDARVNPEMIFKAASYLKVSPADSDFCLMGILGSGTYESDKCTITEKCWSQITNKGQHGYSITHQLLFLFLLKRHNCVEALENVGGQNEIPRLAQMFCSNIHHEMEGIFKRGADPGVDQDLIMEQIMFCGGAGFITDFVRPDILDVILDWQRWDGCYAPYDGSHLPEALAIHDRRAKEIASGLEEERRKKESSRAFMRKPLSEAELRDGCMMHMTSVGGGSLTIYLSAIVQHNLIQATPIQHNNPYWLLVLLVILTVFVLVKTFPWIFKGLFRWITRLRNDRHYMDRV